MKTLRRWLRAELAFLAVVTWLAMCGRKDGEGNPIPCTYCGCPTSGVAHTPDVDANGKRYCSVCHNWL